MKNPLTEARALDKGKKSELARRRDEREMRAFEIELINAAIAATTQPIDLFEDCRELKVRAICHASSGLLFELEELPPWDISVLASEEHTLISTIEVSDWDTPEEAREVRLYLLQSTSEYGAYTVPTAEEKKKRYKAAVRRMSMIDLALEANVAHAYNYGGALSVIEPVD